VDIEQAREDHWANMTETIESRRRLLWAAQKAGYQMAIEDLAKLAQWDGGTEIRGAVQHLQSKLKEF